jgi:hypothetical protein
MKTEEREKVFRTEARKQASGENGARSRGALEGKKRVSPNAQHHGRFAEAIVLDHERKENFTRVTKQYRKHFNPKNALEEGLIEDLAVASWRMRRLRAIETRLRPPHADPFADDPVGFIAAMYRPASSFTSRAHTPQLKLVLQQHRRLYRDSRRASRSLLQARQEAK